MVMDNFISDFLKLKADAVLYMDTKEISVVLDLSGWVMYASPRFCELFQKDNYVGSIFTDINGLSKYRKHINKAIHGSCANDIQQLILFLSQAPYLFSFVPVCHPQNKQVLLVMITINFYQENNVLLQELIVGKNCKLKMNLAKQEYLNILKKLSKFQHVVCYLLARNYTNLEIAEIINLSKCRKQLTSRFAINKQVENIRVIFSMPSKNALVDLLIFLEIHLFLPQLLYHHPIEIKANFGTVYV